MPISYPPNAKPYQVMSFGEAGNAQVYAEGTPDRTH